MEKGRSYKQKNNARIEVDLEAVRHNIDVIRKRAGERKKLMAVVKADAYGHGSVSICRGIAEQVDWLAVNDVQEGIEIRKAGIELPILVFGVPEPETASAYVEHGLTATISSLAHFDRLPAGCRYHLNFDTGMGRLGLSPSQIEVTRDKMKENSRIVCTGIYSHFATADEPGSRKVARQLEAFREIASSFPSLENVHIENTGSLFFHEPDGFSMVRTGIGMYGYAPDQAPIPSLKPALRWKSHLVQVNTVSRGDTVSYGATWKAPEEGYIGIVPVGYEDGLCRRLSGKIRLKIGDRLYPQVGVITMNYCMVFLGDDRLKEGEEVEIINGKELTVEWMAQELDTIPYEVLTSISRYLPRHYV